jgi:hypothetical protein
VLTVVALVATALAGCGTDDEPVAAAPAECLESWNAESIPQRFGRHVYDRHNTQRAQVAVLEPADPDANVDRRGACAVIFAVPEFDREYGTVGLVLSDFGWASMEELALDDQAAQDAIQDAAAEEANATLFPDGKLEAD